MEMLSLPATQEYLVSNNSLFNTESRPLFKSSTPTPLIPTVLEIAPVLSTSLYARLAQRNVASITR